MSTVAFIDDDLKRAALRIAAEACKRKIEQIGNTPVGVVVRAVAAEDHRIRVEERRLPTKRDLALFFLRIASGEDDDGSPDGFGNSGQNGSGQNGSGQNGAGT